MYTDDWLDNPFGLDLPERDADDPVWLEEDDLIPVADLDVLTEEDAEAIDPLRKVR